jgi:hypothetical protein
VGGRGRDLGVAGGAEPGLDALALAELADLADRPLGRAGDRQRRLVAPAPPHRGEREPHRVAEAAVAAARPAPADLLGLEQDDPRSRLEPVQVPGGPEAGEAAADDQHVGLDIASERRRRLDRSSLLDPVAEPRVPHASEVSRTPRSAVPLRCYSGQRNSGAWERA